MGKTFVNQLVLEEVSMALQHMLVAPYGTAFTPGRVDVSSPPAGYIHLGAVVDDSPVVQFQKQKYQLFTGIPRILQYEVVMSLTGEIAATLIATSNFKSYMAGGGVAPQHYPVVAHSTAAPVVTSTLIGRASVTVNTTDGFIVGQLVVTDSSPLIGKTLNQAYVTSIGTGTVYLSTDGFPFIPVAGQPIFAVGLDSYPLGTKQIPYWSLLGVSDFLNDAQVVHHFKRATPRGQWQEQLRVGTEERLNMTFDLHGFVDNSLSENIVGYRYSFSADTLQ